MESSRMNIHPRKFEKIKSRLRRIVEEENLNIYRELIMQASQELTLDPADCAAALLYLNQPHLVHLKPTHPQEDEPAEKSVSHATQETRNVRYRLDVGALHHIDRDSLIAVLIEESGVDRKRIQRLEIRNDYTLVDLPDGMPADIFQLLRDATIGGRKLNIRRIKSGRRKARDSRTQFPRGTLSGQS